jgi:hypothetical protein
MKTQPLIDAMVSSMFLSGPAWAKHWHEDDDHWKQHWQHQERDDDDREYDHHWATAISSRGMCG